MEKIFWEKDRAEISINELMAYTLAKIKPFEWVRRTMYDKNNIFRFPPVFCWRFNGEEEEIYGLLKNCVENFTGNVKWIMYKGDGQNNQSSRNYTIEPQIFFERREKVGNDKLAEILEFQFQKECFDAVNDVENLCKLIEGKFDLANSKPYLPTTKT